MARADGRTRGEYGLDSKAGRWGSNQAAEHDVIAGASGVTDLKELLADVELLALRQTSERPGDRIGAVVIDNGKLVIGRRVVTQRSVQAHTSWTALNESADKTVADRWACC